MKLELSLARKVGIGFSLALAISVVLGAYLYRTALEFKDSSEIVARTHRTISLLQAVLADMVSAESEARGYVITGKEEFLQLYRTGVRDTEVDLTLLKSIVSDSVNKAKLLQLERMMKERLARLKFTVESRRLEGFEAARNASGPGKQLMDDLRAVADAIEGRQHELLAERRDYAATQAGRTLTLVIASGFLAALVAGTSVVILSADVAHRERLEREVLDISEREQRRIGQDLHDGLCQQLTGISLLSRSLQQRLEGPAADEAGRVTQLINECIEQTRLVTRGLHPVPDEPTGLQLALNELATSVTANAGIPCRFDCPEAVPVPDENSATNLYRIVQEAVQNALRHAEARSIVIALKTDDHVITASVTDDGKGLPLTRTGRGLGLEIMNYRARIVGAELTVERGSDAGTVVTCTMPRASLS